MLIDIVNLTKKLVTIFYQVFGICALEMMKVK